MRHEKGQEPTNVSSIALYWLDHGDDKYPHGLQVVVYSNKKLECCGTTSDARHKMFMNSAPEGRNSKSMISPSTFSGKLFQTCTAVWMKVWQVETILKTGTALQEYCKRHWQAGTGGCTDNIWQRVQSMMVCWPYAGVHFVEVSSCCYLMSLVERWDVEFIWICPHPHQ